MLLNDSVFNSEKKKKNLGLILSNSNCILDTNSVWVHIGTILINVIFFKLISIFFVCFFFFSIIHGFILFQESPTGLYICMNTFLGLGKQHVERHCKKSGNTVFLHIKRRRKAVSDLICL